MSETLLAMRALASTWRARIAALLVVVVAFACHANPLTNHPGFASSLVAAVVCTLLSGVASSSLAFALRKREVALSPGGAVLCSMGVGALAVCCFAVCVMSAGLYRELCDTRRGIAFFLALSLPGPMVASVLGTLVGAGIQRRWLAVLASLSPMVGTILWSLVRFYRTPAVFSYDPFFGFYPGALYDETIPLDGTLLTYRLGTVGLLLGVSGLLHSLWKSDGARLERRSALPSWAVCVAGFALQSAVYFAGPALGHRFTAEEVSAELGGRIEGTRCVVSYDRSISGREARLTTEDCAFRVEQLERFFGVRMQSRITVFLFRTAEQKRRLMGAADTYIAKPWRREVYLQYAPFPHPVLKHELAHVVAGAMAAWPLEVSARMRLIPLPGLIEGAAVAAAWEGESDTTAHEWSRAMLELRVLPSASVLTGLGFFLHASGTAYTAAGSFSRWLHDTRGAERFRSVYRDGDFEHAYGASITELERQWHAFLRTVPLQERTRMRARVRFRRAPLHARACPHETAELFDVARAQLAAGALEQATVSLQQVVRNDPTEVFARSVLAEAFVRSGRRDRAITLAETAARELGTAAGNRVRGRIGEVLWRWSDPSDARAVLENVNAELFDEDEARTMEVKRWALGLLGTPPDATYATALRVLLAGEREFDQDALGSTYLMTARYLGNGQENSTQSAMAAYLVARQLVAHDRFEDASRLLSAIDPQGLPSERLRAERWRLLAMARYFSGDFAQARSLFLRLADDEARPRGNRDVARDWVERIDRRTPSR